MRLDKKMNRSLISLIIIILIIAGIPWADGWLFKKKYLEFIEAINNDTSLNIQVTSYRLGWLSSDVVMDVTNKKASADELSNRLLNHHFTIKDHIQHGPLFFNSLYHLPKVDFAYIFESVFNTHSQKIIDIQTKATFSGHFISQIEVPGFERLISLVKLTWEGLKGNTDCSTQKYHLNHCQGYFAIGSFIVKSLLGELYFPKSSYQSEMSLDSRGFWNGSQTFLIPFITLDILNYDIKSMDFNSSQRFGVKDNSYYVGIEMTLQEIATADVRIAPLNLKIELTGLNLNALQTFMKKNPSQIKQLLPYIVTPDTLFSGNLNIGTNHGKCMVSGKSQLSKKIFPIKNVNGLVNNINYEINIQIDKNLVDYIIELSEAHSAVTNVPEEELFQKQIALLQEQKLISVYAASQIKDLQKNPLAFEAYVTLIDRLASTNEISNNAIETLKSLYTLIQPKTETTMPVSQSKNVPESQFHEQLNTWIKQGYVLKSGNEYKTSIVYQEGILKINGVTVQNPNQFQIPSIPANSWN